jgi:hypothetical protein
MSLARISGRMSILQVPLIARSRRAFVTPPLDTKLACLDRDHEEKISHRVGHPQSRDRGLAMPLPVGHGVAEEAQRCVDLGQAPIGAPRPAGFAFAEAVAMVTRNFVAVHWRPSGRGDVTLLHVR